MHQRHDFFIILTVSRPFCPAAQISAIQGIPAAAPRGSYTIVIEVTDSNNAPLMCVDLHLRVSSPSPSSDDASSGGAKGWLPNAAPLKRLFRLGDSSEAMAAGSSGDWSGEALAWLRKSAFLNRLAGEVHSLEVQPAKS